MQSELMSSQNSDMGFSQFENIDTLSMLKTILGTFGTPVTRDDFKKELNNYNQIKVNELGKNLNDNVKHTTKETVEDYQISILTTVIKVNENGTLDVVKPHEKNNNNCWTNIPNPTIYQYLESGDEVILRCEKKNKKSNCWVEFAKLSSDDFEEKTIFKHINKIFDINDNIELLRKWIDIIEKEGEF